MTGVQTCALPIFDGEDVLIPIDAPAVRWIRLEVLETWGGVTDFVHIAELTYYGKEETN